MTSSRFSAINQNVKRKKKKHSNSVIAIIGEIINNDCNTDAPGRGGGGVWV
jgi:hypothetical protein